jgi:hypothetical protein
LHLSVLTVWLYRVHAYDHQQASEESEVTPTPAVEAESTGIYDTMMYVTEEEEASEELDMATVAQLVEQGVIEPDTLCWTEGMDEWMPFEDCSHLFIWPE